MLNGVQSSTVGSAYANSVAKSGNPKESVAKSESRVTQNQPKVDRIKSEVGSGEYKIEIDKVAKKMAEELIS